jgi:hypothetical protein
MIVRQRQENNGKIQNNVIRPKPTFQNTEQEHEKDSQENKEVGQRKPFPYHHRNGIAQDNNSTT